MDKKDDTSALPPSYEQANQGTGFSGGYTGAQYPPQQGQYGNQYGNQYGQPQYGQPQFGGQLQFGGQQMVNSNVVVAQVGPGYGGNTYQAPPQDYTTQAWIACLCCFWPTGILAIMKSSESRDALARGDLTRAHDAARSARTMVRISYAAGIISIIVSLVIVGVYVGVIMNTLNNYDYDD